MIPASDNPESPRSPGSSRLAISRKPAFERSLLTPIANFVLPCDRSSSSQICGSIAGSPGMVAGVLVVGLGLVSRAAPRERRQAMTGTDLVALGYTGDCF